MERCCLAVADQLVSVPRHVHGEEARIQGVEQRRPRGLQGEAMTSTEGPFLGSYTISTRASKPDHLDALRSVQPWWKEAVRNRSRRKKLQDDAERAKRMADLINACAGNVLGGCYGPAKPRLTLWQRFLRWIGW